MVRVSGVGRHRVVRVQEATRPEWRGEDVVGPDFRVADPLHQRVHAARVEGSEQQARCVWGGVRATSALVLEMLGDSDQSRLVWCGQKGTS